MTRLTKTLLLASGAALLTTGFATAPVMAQEILFWSTQARPVEEAQAMRDDVLAGFDGPGEVDYSPQDGGPFITRLEAEFTTGEGTIGLIGALHGDFSALGNDNLMDLSGIDVSSLGISPALLELGQLGSGEQLYMPWMQATYIMAANREALPYLPDGADINALTYDQLIQWATNMAEETGSPKFGIPAGPSGLKHRFFQGYLYPSFTDSMVTEFRSDAAEDMWETFMELWAVTSPASPSYNFMQEPLLTGEVWVAFDHTARLAEAFNQRPEDFVAFPAPAGPTGRGFMPVLAGVGVPVTAPDQDVSMDLTSYLMEPDTQIATLRATNFFPVVDVELPAEMPASVRASSAAVAAQSASADANPGLLPVGLGDLGGQFNAVYVDTFERIALAGQDIRTVLDDQAETLREIMEEAGAPCWAPDPASDGPCPVN
ncbi:MAG: extracellular solute-binding protein [Pseudomonadota bacterium]